MGVDQQAADAVVELDRDRLLLQRREPSGLRRRHRVVGGGERDLVERPVAQRGEPVAAGEVGRRRGGAAGADEGGARRPDEHRGEHRDRDARGGPAAAARGRLRRRGRGRPREHVHDRLDALVEHVDARERRGEPHRGHRLEDDEHADDDEHGAADQPQRGTRGLGDDDPPGRDERALDVDGADQRRRRRGDHGAAAGEQPARRAQVAEERVPYAARRCPVDRIGDPVERERPGHQVGAHDEQPGGDHRLAERLHGLPLVRGQGDRRGRHGEQEHREHDREHAQLPCAAGHLAGRRHPRRGGAARRGRSRPRAARPGRARAGARPRSPRCRRRRA